MAASNSPLITELISIIPELNVDYALEIIGGSEELYENMLMRVIRLIPTNTEQMDGFLADRNGINDFAVRVHGVKSSLRQAGYMRLARRAEELEAAAKDGNIQFCETNYAIFKEELLRFYEQVNAAVSKCKPTEGDTDARDELEGNISDFIDNIKRAVAAAESYDSLSASELLMPLTKFRFGGSSDASIANALQALEMFKARQALEHLTELLNNIS